MKEIESILQILRKKRNLAVHDGYENIEEAKVNLRLAHKLTNWFMEVYGDYYFEAVEFTPLQENWLQKIEKYMVKEVIDKLKEHMFNENELA